MHTAVHTCTQTEYDQIPAHKRDVKALKVGEAVRLHSRYIGFLKKKLGHMTAASQNI